jgi:hypothetical protein
MGTEGVIRFVVLRPKQANQGGPSSRPSQPGACLRAAASNAVAARRRLRQLSRSHRESVIAPWRRPRAMAAPRRPPLRRHQLCRVVTKVINSGGSGRNCTRNSGSGPLPLPLWGSALNFASWNFAAAILNSRPILRPQLRVAGRHSMEANIPN